MKINNKVFSYYVLTQDHLYSYLSKEDACYYVQESEKIAMSEAAKYNIDLIYQEIKNENIAIEFSDDIIGCERSIIEISNTVYTITLFNNTIEYLASIQRELTRNDIINMVIAHEFYHFLEYKNNRFTNELLKKANYKMGIVRRKSSILKTREIAAHHFAFQVLHMKHHPVYYDCIQLILSNVYDKNKLENEIQELERKYMNENS